MTALAGISVLEHFLELMASEARSRAAGWEAGAPAAAPDELRNELDALLAFALTAYEELTGRTREATGGEPRPPDPTVLRAVRDAHATYHAACQPVLQLIGRARSAGVEPRHLGRFMETVGEADLIAHRFEAVAEAEGQADRGQTRPLGEVRDELRRRVHAAGE